MWQPHRLPARPISPISDHMHHELNIKQIYTYKNAWNCNPFYVLNRTYFCQTRAPCLILFYFFPFLGSTLTHSRSIQDTTDTISQRLCPLTPLFSCYIFIISRFNHNCFQLRSMHGIKSIKHMHEHKSMFRLLERHKKSIKRRTCCLSRMNHHPWRTVKL